MERVSILGYEVVLTIDAATGEVVARVVGTPFEARGRSRAEALVDIEVAIRAGSDCCS